MNIKHSLKLLSILFLCFKTNDAFSFVSATQSTKEGQVFLQFENQLERGKIEPNEDKSSFQDASINIYKLKSHLGVGQLFIFSDANLSLDYSIFSSKKEVFENTLIYPSDDGHFLSFGFSGDFLHDDQKKMGLIFKLMPLKKYNKNKFSNPRLDTFTLGVNSSINLSELVFHKSFIQFGSGDRPQQNSSFFLQNEIAFRLDEYIHRSSAFSFGFVLEMDTSERLDINYDRLFSASNRSDRVRASKYGLVAGLDMVLINDLSLNVQFLQKLGGYDARATQVMSIAFGYSLKVY